MRTVTDPGGAVVPDATAELINAATNETKSVTTNSAGQYVFPDVAARASETAGARSPARVAIKIFSIWMASTSPIT